MTDFTCDLDLLSGHGCANAAPRILCYVKRPSWAKCPNRRSRVKLCSLPMLPNSPCSQKICLPCVSSLSSFGRCYYSLMSSALAIPAYLDLTSAITYALSRFVIKTRNAVQSGKKVKWLRSDFSAAKGIVQALSKSKECN